MEEDIFLKNPYYGSYPLNASEVSNNEVLNAITVETNILDFSPLNQIQELTRLKMCQLTKHWIENFLIIDFIRIHYFFFLILLTFLLFFLDKQFWLISWIMIHIYLKLFYLLVIFLIFKSSRYKIWFNNTFHNCKFIVLTNIKHCIRNIIIASEMFLLDITI